MALIIEFVNNGNGPDDNASYDVRVRVNQRVIARGTVSGHNRRDHWTMLVRRMLDEHDKSPAAAVGVGGSAGQVTSGATTD